MSANFVVILLFSTVLIVVSAKKHNEEDCLHGQGDLNGLVAVAGGRINGKGKKKIFKNF